MHPSFPIRIARLDDALGIAEVHIAAWQTAYRGLMSAKLLDSLNVQHRAVRWSEILTTDTSTTLVATSAERIAAFCSYGSSRDDDTHAAADGRPVGEIWALYVHPDYLRRGIGRALLRAALAAVAEQGFGRVTLWVLEANRRAIAFYEAMGFARDGHRTDHECGPGVVMPSVRLRWELGGMYRSDGILPP